MSQQNTSRVERHLQRAQQLSEINGEDFPQAEIDRIGSELDLDDHVISIAEALYNQAEDSEIVQNRSIEEVVSASVYGSCRQNSAARNIDEIADVSRVEKKMIARTYRIMSRELGLSVEPVKPATYLPRFIDELNAERSVPVDGQVQKVAQDVLDLAGEAGNMSGKSPSGYAAAAIYVAGRLTEESITQGELAQISGASEVTIRNRYQEQQKIWEEHWE